MGLALLLGLAALAVSCTSKESPFVGKWTPQDPAAPRENMELRADPTLVLGKRGDEPSTGTWTGLDDGRLKMDVRMHEGVAFGPPLLFSDTSCSAATRGGR